MSYLIRTLNIGILLLLFAIACNGANILFFNQDCNFDLAGVDGTCADERNNLLNILTDDGHNITLLSNFNDSNLASLLAANDMLAIPDLEDPGTCSISDAAFLSASAKTEITNYVNGGGGMFIAGSTQTIALLNDLFSLSLSTSGSTSTGVSTLNDTQAAGTPFAECPATIPNISATFLLTSSMPSTKRCIYESGSGTSVAFFSVGSGTVIYMGYDYNDVGPGCAVDADAFISCATDGGVDVADDSDDRAIPTLGEWGIMILMLFMTIMGLQYIKENSISQLED